MKEQDEILAEDLYVTIGIIVFRNRSIFKTLCNWAANIYTSDSIREVEDKATIRKMLRIKTSWDKKNIKEE